MISVFASVVAVNTANKNIATTGLLHLQKMETPIRGSCLDMCVYNLRVQAKDSSML